MTTTAIGGIFLVDTTRSTLVGKVATRELAPSPAIKWTVKMTSIRHWQSELEHVYPNVGRSPDYMMVHVYTGCSDLGRLLLRSERDQRRDSSIISSLSWLMALSNHFTIDYETAIVNRFPGRCNYCLARPCQCDRTGKRAKRHDGSIFPKSEIENELYIKAEAIRNVGTDVSFSWLLNQISEIYPSNRALLSKGGQDYVVGKMLEEGGELHRAYSGYLRGKNSKSDIEWELADLTAWIISCWDIDGIGKNLDAEFAGTYARGCNVCHQKICICPPYSITLGQEEIFRDIMNALRKIADSGKLKSEVEEVMALTDETAASPSTERKRTLKDKLGGLLSILKGVKEGAEGLEGAETAIEHAVDLLGQWM